MLTALLVARAAGATLFHRLTASNGLANSGAVIRTRRPWKTSQGVNRPPTAVFGAVGGSPQPSNIAVEMLGNGQDPDEGFLCGRDLCVEGRASGPCTFTRFDCTCLRGVAVYVKTTSGPGTCRVTLVVQDEWGLRGSGTSSFAVNAP